LVNIVNMMLKAYKYRLYPTKKQQKLLEKHFGCCRYIYNWALELKTKSYTNDKKKLSFFDLGNLLPQLKKENTWLKEINSQSLQQSIKHVESAFTRFFREKKGFPKFKSKHRSRSSFSIPQNVKVDFEKSYVVVPKVGKVNTIFSREFEGKVKTCVVSKTRTNKYYISILVETKDTIPKKSKIKEKTSLGIDLGIKHFLITSNGDKIDNPKFLAKDLKKLKVLQRRASKKVKGSNSRRKANLKVARTHEKITNKRTDFLHKLSTRLIRENQTICLEDLAVSNMIKNHKLARSISDVSWSNFVSMLQYKSEWYGTNIVFIGRFDPSSKLCSSCGTINKNLVLSDRDWICEKCKTTHDRDINAAINIKSFALQKQNLINKSPTDCGAELLEISCCNENL